MNYESASKLGAEKHSKNVSRTIQYGTAGFRSKNDELDFVMYRMGLLSVLRSKAKKGASIGVMITASHNPEHDNGIKLVDPHGEMLESSWESLATNLVNVSDEAIGDVLHEIIKICSIDVKEPANIIVGRDTRSSSPRLAKAVIDGIQVLCGSIQDHGILSTPQLHYIVCCVNTKEKYGKATEIGYFQKISSALIDLFGDVKEVNNYKPIIKFDGANGVGALKMIEFSKYLCEVLDVTVFNDGTSGQLNYLCGADYVKVQQKPPQGLNMSPGVTCVSVDGDADRVVYYYSDNNDKFHLLDGDKIATLIAGYLKEVIIKSGLQLNLGLVQTAYANGSSTNYISKSLKVPVACVPTGVKHLHHKALEYDVGVYFEANGHGTVIFSENSLSKIENARNDESLSSEQRTSANHLSNLVDVINQTVGDGISDMFLVETILRARGWACQDWDQTYTDLCNRQLKVKVADRTVIKTEDAERKCSSPSGLQEAIDELVLKYPLARSFVRPSGTEDIVRVYAESDSQENADQLAHEVSIKVYEMAGGIGDKPSK